MFQNKSLSKMFSEGLNTVSFCRVMTRGDIMYPRLPGNMHSRLRYLSAEVGIEALGNGLINEALSRSRAPSYAGDVMRTPRDDLRYAP
jgi:hypothetical protein